MHPWPTLSRLSMTQFVPPLPNLILPLLVPTVMRPTLASYSPRPIMVPIFIRYQTLSGKHGVHPAGTRGLIHHGGFFGYRGPHYRGRREAEAEGDAEARDERSYGHGKAHQAHPGPGKFDLDAGLGDWDNDAVTMN